MSNRAWQAEPQRVYGNGSNDGRATQHDRDPFVLIRVSLDRLSRSTQQIQIVDREMGDDLPRLVYSPIR